VSDHSKLSPSGAERWFNCPGSVALNATVPPSKPKQYSTEGTVAHSILQELMDGKTDELSLLGRVGEVIQKDGFDIEITEEMVDAVIVFRDTVEEDRLELERKQKPAKVVGKAEVRVCASSVDKDLWGTADYVLYRPGDALFVYDFKYGKGYIVEPDENKQMAIYGLAVLDGESLDEKAFEKRELVIVQPRGSHVDGTVRRWSVPAGWFSTFRDEAKAAVARTDVKDAEVVSGSWCHWCPAGDAGKCLILLKKIEEQTLVDFSMVPVNPPSVQSLPAVEGMSVTQMASILDWKEVIVAWFGAVEEQAQRSLEEGKEVPGYKLVDKRTHRQWADEAEVEARYGSVLGEGLWEKKLLSPSKLEKRVGKKNFDASLTVKPAAGKTIAKAIDARPKTVSRALEDFASVGVDDVDPLAVGAIWPR